MACRIFTRESCAKQNLDFPRRFESPEGAPAERRESNCVKKNNTKSVNLMFAKCKDAKENY